MTVLGGATRVLSLVFIHVLISEAIALAAAAAVGGFAPPNCAAKPTGAGGGVGTNPAMPPPTVTANAANALSMPGIAEGAANAPASDEASAALALATVVDAGTMLAAQPCTASAHDCAHAA